MLDKLFSHMMAHLDILGKMHHLTTQIYQASLSNDIDLITQLTLNRDRLLNIVADFQKKVENTIMALNPEDIQSARKIITDWVEDTQGLTEKITELDKKSTLLLEEMKESTTKEIASVYKTKQSLKGYNLNDLKK